MKKLFALLLAVIMVVGLFAGCQKTPAADDTTAGKVDDSKETTAAPVEDETTEGEIKTGIELKDSWDDEETMVISIPCAYLDAFNEAGIESYSDTRIGQQILDWFNIQIDLYAQPEVLNDYFMTCLATGDLPMVIHNCSNDVLNAYYEAGKLVNLDDYAELLPNHLAAIGEVNEDVYRAKFPDGGLWQWGGDANSGSVLKNGYTTVGFNNNRIDAFRAYGLDKYPVSFSDYDQFWRTVLAMDEFKTAPDGSKVYGFSFAGVNSSGDTDLGTLLKPGKKLDEGNFHAYAAVYYDVATDSFVNMWSHYDYEDVSHGAKYYNAWYRDGILDPECFADTIQTMTEKQMNGRLITTRMNAAQEATINASLEQLYGDQSASVINTLYLDDNQTGFYRSASSTGWNIAMTTAIVEGGYIDRFCAFLDWARSEEGLLLYGSGEEGIDYEWVDGVRNPIGQYRQDVIDGFSSDYRYKTGMWESYTLYRLTGGSWANCSIDNEPFRMNRMSTVATELSCNDVQKQFLSDMGWTSYTECFNEASVFYDDRFMPKVSSDAVDVQDALTWYNEKLNEWSAKIVRSDDFDTDMKAFIEEMSASEELQTIVDYYNDLYETKKAEGLGFKDLNPDFVFN